MFSWFQKLMPLRVGTTRTDGLGTSLPERKIIYLSFKHMIFTIKALHTTHTDRTGN